jgi:hypothetical protein
LLFSDIEGSTQLLTRLGAAYADALGSEPYDSAFGNEALTGWTKRRPTGRNGPGQLLELIGPHPDHPRTDPITGDAPLGYPTSDGALALTWANASSRDWTRTNNLPVNSRLLCQLSYAGPPVGATPLG